MPEHVMEELFTLVLVAVTAWAGRGAAPAADQVVWLDWGLARCRLGRPPEQQLQPAAGPIYPLSASPSSRYSQRRSMAFLISLQQSARTKLILQSPPVDPPHSLPGMKSGERRHMSQATEFQQVSSTRLYRALRSPTED